jgi:outer membrane protein OmpA-like peptidoglycan-associated protein
VGSDAINTPLSLARARAVAEYLVKQWEIPRQRLRVTGYGASKPLCNEASPASADMSLEDCRTLNRSTRIAVFQGR